MISKLLGLLQSPTARKFALPALGVVVFLLTLQLSFPYEKIVRRAAAQIDDYELTFVKVTPGLFPGSFSLHEGVFRDAENTEASTSSAINDDSEASRQDEKSLVVFFDTLSVNVSLLGVLRGKYAARIDVELEEGEIAADISVTKDNFSLDVMTSDVTGASLQGVTQSFGLPLDGELLVDASIRVPLEKKKADTEKTTGYIEVTCTDCVLGDGVSQIDIGKKRANQRNYEPKLFTVPKLRIGNFLAKVVMSDGKAVIEDFGSQSDDGQVAMEGDIALATPLDRSVLDACLKYSLSEDLRSREQKFAFGVATVPTQADGQMHLRWSGRLSKARRKALPEGRPCVVGQTDKKFRPRKRPPRPAKKPKKNELGKDGTDDSLGAKKPNRSGGDFVGVGKGAADAGQRLPKTGKVSDNPPLAPSSRAKNSEKTKGSFDSQEENVRDNNASYELETEQPGDNEEGIREDEQGDSLNKERRVQDENEESLSDDKAQRLPQID